jgi:Cysteine-rich secretory protein family
MADLKRYGIQLRSIAVCGLMGVSCVGLGGTRLLGQDGRSVAADRQIFDLTNQDRQAQGLQPLVWNEALATAAQAHANRMSQEHELSHQYPGEPELMQRAAAAGAHYQAIAENIAMAGNAQGVENAWMKSTPHRTNILDPKMNALGVGVVERGGYLYAVEDFAAASQALTVTQVEQKVGGLLSAMHVDPSGPANEAEAACAMEHGMPPGTKARSLVRFETPDLTQLPSQVAQQIQSGGFTRAAVGACAPRETNPNFTSYRVTVLLY